MSATPALKVEELRHGYEGRAVIDGVSLSVASRGVTCLLGPSGCGKTTLLRIVSGLETPWSGTVELDGHAVEGKGLHLSPEKRNVGFVFQDYALFPHLTVMENVLFGMPRGDADAERQAAALIERLGLSEKARDYPHVLSGGQQQRVALARALAPDPSILLLDEPFSGLDTVLRRRVHEELREVLHETGVAAVVVTHDPEEAMILGDRIALMREGRVEQEGTPEELYLRPRTPFAMRFLGESNALSVTGDGTAADTPFGAVPSDGLAGEIVALMRPEAVKVTREKPADTEAAKASVISRVFVGRATRLHMKLKKGDQILTAHIARLSDIEPGADVWLSVAPEDILLFPQDQDGDTVAR